MAALVLEYYALLRSILRTRPQLWQCLTRCRHCWIFFVADPRNAGRCDLRCPFGCKEIHRKRQSTQRSVAFYHGRVGKILKRLQNGKRGTAKQALDAKVAEGAPAPDEAMVEHVRMVTSLIEGRQVGRKEILAMLRKVLRQHSIGERGKIGDNVARSDEHPP